ncbi:MAG: class II aldolase/adducin family protein [Bacteroidetes bacterium]|nr:class II aldolase/adducin family protein [Bacteroidota bacterium]
MTERKYKTPMPPGELISFIIRRIYQNGLTTTSGGNISMMDDHGDIWISPAAMDKGTLQPSDIIRIQPDGKITGPHSPSSEYPFHKAIYTARQDIKAIIHAHPPALVSFSIVRQIPDTKVIAHTRRICGEVGYAGYELPGSEALGRKIDEQFRKGFHALIMENHGAVIGGADLPDAYHRFETLEFCAKTVLLGKILGTVRNLTDEQIISFENQLPELLPEMDIVSHPSDEKKKRSSICGIMDRACHQGLMISTYGTVSVRWKGNDFLITPADIPNWNIRTEDIVQIQEGKREPGKIPGRSAWLHQRIYRENPGICSIIQTLSPCLMAFGITNTRMNVRTIPESWIFLQDLPTVSFDALSPATTNIPQLFSTGNPGLIIGNDSVIFTGETLLQTFDRLEVAEFSAKSILLGASLGKMTPISDDQVEDLRKAFLKC